MGRRDKEIRPNPKSLLDHELEEPDNPIRNLSDSDDEAANEDLSLKIVAKAMSRATADGGAGEEFVGKLDEDIVASEVVASKVVKKKVKKVKKKKAKKSDNEIKEVTLLKEEVAVTANEAEQVKIAETDAVDNSNSDNAVLRKLLRGPRYFDPPDKSWGACFNCGEEGHSAANCKSAQRKRPCFICGSLEHEVKQCQKGKDCFICKGGGHRAKDCPKKYKQSSQGSELCLRCGAAGHAMISCNKDYSLDDLKEIQCYVCKKFGHLCCANYSDAFTSEASCYKCGQSGHNGQECRGSRGETSAGKPSSCFKCGKEGHFARECTESAKVKKRTRDFSTPTGKRPKDNKGRKIMKSAPQEFGKGHKKKKLLFDDASPIWSGKSKRRGGWITDDYEDHPHKNAWRSPSTPNVKHKIYSLNDSDRGSASYSSNRRSNYSSYGTSSSHGYVRPYQHNNRYSASRFGYSNGDGMRRNYDWW